MYNSRYTVYYSDRDIIQLSATVVTSQLEVSSEMYIISMKYFSMAIYTQKSDYCKISLL